MVVKLSQFCCGSSLGRGTIIIGIIETLVGILKILLSVIAALQAAEDLQNVTEQDALDTIMVTNIILAVAVAVLTSLAVLLILGAKRNNPSLLVPWMIYACFYIFVAVVSYVINTVAYSQTGEMLQSGASVVGAVLAVSIETYYILVVYSFYRELRGENLLNPCDGNLGESSDHVGG